MDLPSVRFALKKRLIMFKIMCKNCVTLIVVAMNRIVVVMLVMQLIIFIGRSVTFLSTLKRFSHATDKRHDKYTNNACSKV